MKPLTTCVLGVLFITLAAFARPAAAAFPGQNGRIAFASNRSGNFEIYAANSDGTGLADLTATPGIDEFEPAWSPDGRRLAYRRDGAIWVMNADGSAQTQLTGGSAVGEFAKEPTGRRTADRSRSRASTASSGSGSLRTAAGWSVS